MKVYLSPSTQEKNLYAGGGNEEQYMRKVCSVAADLLLAAGHKVKVGGTVSAASNVRDSNAWGAELHIAVHSNAGGGHGTEAWHYPGSTKGAALARAVYKAVAAVSNEPDRGVKASASYTELADTKAPATIIEVAFHDCAKEAAEIRSDYAEFGRAVAEGIRAVAGGTIPAPKPAPAPAPAPAGWRVTSQTATRIVLDKAS